MTPKNSRARKVFLISFLLFFVAFFTALVSVETQAQDLRPADRPEFPKKKIEVAHKTIEAEIADTDERRTFGLMFKTILAENSGMLFVFPDEQHRSFWMKNTLIPLSIGYFDKNKILREIIHMDPAPLGATRPKSYPTKSKAMFALEMNQGWFERNKIRPGVRLKFADN